MRACACVIVLLLAFTRAAGAKDLFVSPSGDDSVSHGDNGPGAPWRTLQRALAQAQPGDVVRVSPGTYALTPGSGRWGVAANPANSGTAAAPITFLGWTDEARAMGPTPGQSVILQHGGPSPTIGCSSRNYIRWHGFYVDEANAPASPDTGPGVIFGATGCAIEHTEIRSVNAAWCDNHNAIRLEQTTGARVIGNLLHNVGSRCDGNTRGENDAGVMTYDAIDTTIRGNTIAGVGTGIFLKGSHNPNGQRQAVVELNDIGNYTRHGIVALDVNDATIARNFIHDGPGAMAAGIAIYTLGGGPNRVTVTQNTIVRSDLGWLTRGDGPGYTAVVFDRNLFVDGRLAGGSEQFSSLGATPAGEPRAVFTNNHYHGQSGALVSLGASDYSFGSWRESGKTNGNPRFVSSTDFGLQAGSPAAGKGAFLGDGLIPGARHVTTPIPPPAR